MPIIIDNKQYISASEYASRKGVSYQAILKHIHAGNLPFVHKGNAYLLNAADADAALRRATLPDQRHIPLEKSPDVPVSHPVISSDTDYLSAKTLTEKLKARQMALRIEQQRGRLVDKAKTRVAVFGLAQRLRDHWLIWPARHSAEIAAELGVDSHAMRTVLERYVRAHLETIASDSLSL